MADEIDKVEIQIVLDDGSVQKGFVNVKKESKKAGKSIKDNFSSAFGSLSKRLAVVGAAVGAAFAGREIIKAASRQEDAINELNTSLKLAGAFSEQSSQNMQMFANELQKVSTVGDETTLGLLALSRNFTKTNEEAQRLTKAAVELSAATGGRISVDSAVNNLGKSLSGLAGELGESVPGFRDLSAESLKAGAGIELILDRFGGAALAKTKTFSGAIKQAGNSFGDLLEELGFFITRNPAVVKVINDLNGGIKSIAENISKFSKAGGFRDITLAILSLGKAINFVVTGPLEILANTAISLFKNLRLGAQTLLKGIVDLAGKVIQLLPDGSAIKNSFNDVKAAVDSTFQDFVTDADKSNKAILGSFKVTNEIDEYINKLTEAVVATDDATGRMKNSTNDLSKSVAESFSVTNKQINNALGKSLSSGIQGAVKALSTGENAFEAFGKSVLASFGGFLVELGQGAILVGFAAQAVEESIKSLQGGQAIAAGIALVALGSAFQAIGGGSEGTTTSDGGGVAGGNVEAGSNVSTGQLDETPQGRGQEVNVSVTGNLVDPRGAAQAIAELLNDGSRGSGIVVNV